MLPQAVDEWHLKLAGSRLLQHKQELTAQLVICKMLSWLLLML